MKLKIENSFYGSLRRAVVLEVKKGKLEAVEATDDEKKRMLVRFLNSLNPALIQIFRILFHEGCYQKDLRETHSIMKSSKEKNPMEPSSSKWDVSRVWSKEQGEHHEIFLPTLEEIRKNKRDLKEENKEHSALQASAATPTTSSFSSSSSSSSSSAFFSVALTSTTTHNTAASTSATNIRGLDDEPMKSLLKLICGIDSSS